MLASLAVLFRFARGRARNSHSVARCQQVFLDDCEEQSIAGPVGIKYAHILVGDCRKRIYQITQGSLPCNERLGQEPKTGAQAKQGQRSAGIVRLQDATTGA